MPPPTPREHSTASKAFPPRPHYTRSVSISIPSLPLKYPVIIPHQDIGHDCFGFSSNASQSLISWPRGINALSTCTTPERDPLKPLDLLNDRYAIASSSHEEAEEKTDATMNLNGLRPSGIRIRPALRSQRLRAFHHNDSSPPPEQRPQPISTTSVKPSFELLPTPPSPTRTRSFSWRNRLGSFFAIAQWERSRILSFSHFSHPTSYLALYFTLNLILTLYNKLLLNNFPFPYTLSALHALCGSIGCAILIRNGSNPIPRLNVQETLVLLAFSGLYTLNIILSNVSLGLVTVPFHQVVRASTPLFTILFSAFIFGTWSSRRKLVSLLPVVFGVGLATYGDYYFTPWGFFLTLLGTILASLKTIFTHVLQASPAPPAPSFKTETSAKRPGSLYRAGFSDARTSSNDSSPPPPSPRFAKLPPLSPLHLLYLLSPLSFVETVFLAHFTGEFERLLEYVGFEKLHWSNVSISISGPMRVSGAQIVLLLINGAMAFALNVVSFSANRKVGALSMTVAANVKQVLTVLCAVVLFNLTITPMNAVGIALTLFGGAVYAAVELEEKRRQG